MPDEVVETPEVIAEPEETISPPEGEVVEPEQGTDEPDLKTLLKGTSVDELKALLDSVDPEVRGELEQEIERRGEQRATTRQREVERASDARTTAFKQFTESGNKAASFLRERINRAQQGDPEALTDTNSLAQAIDAYRNGAVASAALDNEQMLSPLRDKYLPEPTPEERTKLEKALYDDGVKGTLSQLPIMLELATARAREEGKAEGIKQGERNREAKAAVAEKLRKLTEVKKQAAGVQPQGRARTPSENNTALVREMESIDVTTPEGHQQWLANEDRYRRAVRSA